MSFLGVSANLALHEETGESSKYRSDTEGKNAVNGRVDDYDLAQHFASASTSSALDSDPYWYVKLDDMYLVQAVEIFSRRDCSCPADRMETIEVRVGMYNNLLHVRSNCNLSKEKRIKHHS